LIPLTLADIDIAESRQNLEPQGLTRKIFQDKKLAEEVGGAAALRMQAGEMRLSRMDLSVRFSWPQ
jgi:hypothetical protein